jgi:putative tricarboxylic transport membrane protein
VDTKRSLRRLASIGSVVVAAMAPWSSLAAEWKPTKNVEIVVGAAAGGPLDRTARLLQKLADDRKIGVPVSVLNRTGGGHAIAYTYLNQHAGDGHHLAMASPLLLTNRITGSHSITYTDVTPLAMLTREYVGMSVRADSPFKTGLDVIERLRASPSSVTIAITGRAGAQHLVAATIMKAAGVDLKSVRFVSFKGGAETTVAVLGGHVDVVMATPFSVLKHVQAGKMRMLGITAPSRLPGELAEVPTWREMGIDAVSSNWRAVIGTKGMSKAHIAFWDQFLSGVANSAEWQEILEKNRWDGDYRSSADTFKFMEAEYKHLEGVLKESGDAKAVR